MELTALANPWVMAAIIVGLAIVLTYALSRPQGKLEIKMGGLSANVDKNGPGLERGVSVANGLRVDGQAGHVTGVRGGAAAAVNRPIDVATGAQIHGIVGDITGVDASLGGRS